jgi:hypothetical protein
MSFIFVTRRGYDLQAEWKKTTKSSNHDLSEGFIIAVTGHYFKNTRGRSYSYIVGTCEINNIMISDSCFSHLDLCIFVEPYMLTKVEYWFMTSTGGVHVMWPLMVQSVCVFVWCSLVVLMFVTCFRGTTCCIRKERAELWFLTVVNSRADQIFQQSQFIKTLQYVNCKFSAVITRTGYSFDVVSLAVRCSRLQVSR